MGVITPLRPTSLQTVNSLAKTVWEYRLRPGVIPGLELFFILRGDRLMAAHKRTTLRVVNDSLIGARRAYGHSLRCTNIHDLPARAF
jgi:hypothetical protein